MYFSKILDCKRVFKLKQSHCCNKIIFIQLWSEIGFKKLNYGFLSPFIDWNVKTGNTAGKFHCYPSLIQTKVC